MAHRERRVVELNEPGPKRGAPGWGIRLLEGIIAIDGKRKLKPNLVEKLDSTDEKNSRSFNNDSY